MTDLTPLECLIGSTIAGFALNDEEDANFKIILRDGREIHIDCESVSVAMPKVN